MRDVVPSGYIGLSRRDTDEYSAAVTSAKLFSNDMHGWVPFSAILARLGLSEEFSHMLEEIYEREPVQVNGTRVDSSGLAGEWAGPEAPLDLRSSMARYTTGTGRFPNQTKSFRFFSIHSDMANGMNEMLLQSHDGIIRPAPAADSRRSARFTLHAVGGFVVSAEIDNGCVSWVAVESRRGERCRLANPWRRAEVFRNGAFEASSAKSLISIDTHAGDLLMVLPDRESFEKWETIPIRHEPNKREKRCSIGKNMLGMPRTF